jgi:hypothetical protein
MVLGTCFSQCLEPTPLRQRGRVSEARLSRRGRVTMRGLARWSGTDGSARTIQRFLPPSLHGGPLHGLLRRPHCLDADAGVVMRGEDGGVTQAGTTPYGVARLWASLSGKAVPGLCCLRVSLLRVKRRTSYPGVTAQAGHRGRGASPATAAGRWTPGTAAREQESPSSGGRAAPLPAFSPSAAQAMAAADWGSVPGGVRCV